MTERTYEDITREYNQARCDHARGFREHLIERGVVITSPDHLATERINYEIAHPEEIDALEALTVEFATANAERDRACSPRPRRRRRRTTTARNGRG